MVTRWSGQVAVLYDANRRVRGKPAVRQGGRGFAELSHAHEQDHGVVGAGRDLGEFLVAGDHAEALGQAAVRDGDAGRGRDGDRGGDAGDHFNLDAVLRGRIRLPRRRGPGRTGRRP